jgi:glyoxylase-like metal-dependent hydrolase (beta-lactamase superfamily II)
MNERTLLSRRRFLVTTSLVAGAAASAAWLRPASLFAQGAATRIKTALAQAPSAKITTQSLRGNVSALRGSGGNIAVLTGKDGKIIVDSGFSAAKPQISEALAALSADPITHLINTHWHADHTDGNEWMHAAGAIILAHLNTKTRLSTTQTVAAWQTTFPPAPAGAIPTETFTDNKTLHLNGTTLQLAYYGPSHTDTDISIYFADVDILHAGDTWWNPLYPFIDYSTGGHINGMIKATERNLAASTAHTIIIPGHGRVGDKAQLTQYRDMLVATRDKVAALKKQGRTLDEVIAAKPNAVYDAQWGPATEFLGYVYQGV